jgi:hypothetical protein
MLMRNLKEGDREEYHCSSDGCEVKIYADTVERPQPLTR